MTDPPALTVSAVLGGASDVLEHAGFQRIDSTMLGKWPHAGARAYEDPYSVVALLVYDTWSDISSTWTEAQAALVELISQHFSRSEAKAWEGYLVLLTPSVIPTHARSEATEIERNTTHVRKLLASGEELRGIGDVERVLLPLLPLAASAALVEPKSAFDVLPQLLSRRGIDSRAVHAAIEAFVNQQPIIEHLHAHMTARNEGQP